MFHTPCTYNARCLSFSICIVWLQLTVSAGLVKFSKQDSLQLVSFAVAVYCCLLVHLGYCAYLLDIQQLQQRGGDHSTNELRHERHDSFLF